MDVVNKRTRTVNSLYLIISKKRDIEVQSETVPSPLAACGMIIAYVFVFAISCILGALGLGGIDVVFHDILASMEAKIVRYHDIEEQRNMVLEIDDKLYELITDLYWSQDA